MTLRPAALEDVAAMHVLRMSVLENRQRDPSRITEADYHPFLRQPRASWVAEDGNRLVGFAIADIKARSVWALFVSPDCEGRGIGRSLLKQLTSCLIESGSGPIHLFTEPGTRAARFYAAAGWFKTGIDHNGQVRFERNVQGAA